MLERSNESTEDIEEGKLLPAWFHGALLPHRLAFLPSSISSPVRLLHWGSHHRYHSFLLLDLPSTISIAIAPSS